MTQLAVLAGLDRATGRFLENLLQDAVNGMAILDLDGRFCAVNPAMCRILGRRADETIGLSPTDITHPDDRSGSADTGDQLMSGHISTDQRQKRYVRPDGTPVAVLRTVTVVRSTSDRPVGFFTQVVDLTEVAEAQQSARRSEMRFKALVANASDLTVVLDGEGRITYASPAAESLLGCAPEALEGRSTFEFIHPDDLGRAKEAFGRHLSHPGKPNPVLWRIHHRDLGWRQAQVLVTNLLDDPSVGGLVVNVRDVTEEVEFRDRLAASEHKFRALVGNSWDIITIHDADGRFLYCSPAITAQLGYTPEEMIGIDGAPLLHPDDAAAAERLWATAKHGRTVQYRFRHKDGSWRWLESTSKDRSDDPAIGGLVVTTRNVTARWRRSAQQRAVAELTSSALDGGPIEDLEAQAVRLVAEVLEAEHAEIVTPVDGLEPGAATALIVPGAGPTRALCVRSSRSEAFPHADVSFLEAVANVLAAAITRDGIELELREQALHDNLTGLPNRILLHDRLQTALARLSRRGGCVSVLFVDLDNFKLVNDSLGHPAGDRLVSIVAARISEVVRASDTVARFGGDEFVVLCEDTDETVARQLAERIRQVISAPVELEGRSVRITTSVGMVSTADSKTTPDELLSMADTAMYASKDGGKDCVMPFARHMRTEATERLEAFSGIRRALSNGEFRLVYQPIVSLETGGGLGFEALVRWEHPTEGLLSPSQFIDYAEAGGLIIPLGEWVIRTACAQSAAWNCSGRPGYISVNVSGLQLTQSDIAATIADALEESGAAPGDVYLEVTENAVMTDVQKATAAMCRIHQLGVHIGMDDFGTGHSSLSQLADLPFDYVKIDRSFIQRFDRDRRAADLLEAIVTLCRTLDLDAVAEGVETVQQMNHLKSLGVRFAQGFLFGRPVPAEECAELTFDGIRLAKSLRIAG